MYVDVHAHLDHPDFSDLDEVIKNAKAAGVSAIITQGTSYESNLKVLEIAKKYDIVKAALGIYPLHALNVKSDYPSETEYDVDSTLEFIKKNKDKIIAIGEIGMDFAYSDDKSNQINNFEKIIELSEKIKKPLIIHSRKAEKEVLDVLESYNSFNHVMHCFSPRKSIIKRAIDLNLHFSIPTIVTRSIHFQNLVNLVPLSKLLTETDCPYLPHIKDIRNEPKYIPESVKMIAKIKNLTLEETKAIIYQNYQSLFL